MFIIIFVACISVCSLLFGAAVLLKNFFQKSETNYKLFYIKTNIMVYHLLDTANIIGLVGLYRSGIGRTIALILLPLSQLSVVCIHMLLHNFSIYNYYTHIRFKWLHFGLGFIIQLTLALTVLLIQQHTYSLGYVTFENASRIIQISFVTMKVIYTAFTLLKIAVEMKGSKRTTPTHFRNGLRGLNQVHSFVTVLKQNMVFFAYCLNTASNLTVVIYNLSFEKKDYRILNLIIFVFCSGMYLNMYLFYHYFEMTNKLIKNKKVLKKKLTDPNFIKTSCQTLENWNLEHIAITMKYYSKQRRYKDALEHTVKCVKETTTDMKEDKSNPFNIACRSTFLTDANSTLFTSQFHDLTRLIGKLELEVIETKSSFDGTDSRDKYITLINSIMEKNNEEFKKKTLKFLRYLQHVDYKLKKGINDGCKSKSKTKSESALEREERKENRVTNIRAKAWKKVYIKLYSVQLKHLKNVNRDIFKLLEEDSYIKNFAEDN